MEIGLLKGTLVKWVTNGGNRYIRRKKIKDEYLENFLGRKYGSAMLKEYDFYVVKQVPDHLTNVRFQVGHLTSLNPFSISEKDIKWYLSDRPNVRIKSYTFDTTSGFCFVKMSIVNLTNKVIK